MSNHHEQGSLLIEVLVSAGFLVIFSVAIGSLAAANNHLITGAKHETEAAALAKESMEQLYAAKNDHWSSVSDAGEGIYVIQESDNSFILSPDTQALPGERIHDTFTRIVTVSKVYRNPAGAIADSGTEDPNARKLGVSVSWFDRGMPKDVTLTGYVTNWKGE